MEDNQYFYVLKRWLSQPQIDSEQYDMQLLQTQRKFKYYKYSIYVMQRAALKI